TISGCVRRSWFRLGGSGRPPPVVAATSISRRARARPGGWPWPPYGASTGGCKSWFRAGRNGRAAVGWCAGRRLLRADVWRSNVEECGDAADPGAFGGLPAGVPDDLVSDRSVGRVMRAAWEQPDGRFAG